MKTAISIPDALFRKAEAAAKKLGVSRSKLLQTALEQFLNARQNEEITERLNKSYGACPQELDPLLQTLVDDTVRRTEWTG